MQRTKTGKIIRVVLWNFMDGMWMVKKKKPDAVTRKIKKSGHSNWFQLIHNSFSLDRVGHQVKRNDQQGCYKVHSFFDSS